MRSGVAHRGQLRSAPVDRHEDHVVEVEALDELREEIGERVQRQVGVGIHRAAMAAEREHRYDAPAARRDALHHLVPQGGVHDETAGEHDDASGAAGVFVIDRSARQLHRLHGRPPVRERA